MHFKYIDIIKSMGERTQILPKSGGARCDHITEKDTQV